MAWAVLIWCAGVWRYLVTDKIQFHAFFYSFYIMRNQKLEIANPKLHLSENCSSIEREILSLYWELDGTEFKNTPKSIKRKYNISQSELTQLCAKHSKLSFYILCENCNSYERHGCKSQSGFLNILNTFRSHYQKKMKCVYCIELQKNQERKEKARKHLELIERLRKAIKDRNWENLSSFDTGVLKSLLEMNFDELKSYYGKILGQINFKKLIIALRNIESQHLIVLNESYDGWITNYKYLDELKGIKDEITIIEEPKNSEVDLNSKTGELKFKLTINSERNHPDSPLYAGTIVFKKRIVIEPNVEYVFAQWERAHNNLYLTMIPTDEFEKLPEQKRLSSLPIHLREGITSFLDNLGGKLDF